MFEWDEANESKVEAHGLTVEEVETAFDGPTLDTPMQTEGGESRYRFVGFTGAAVIVVVYTERGDLIRVVTAFPAGRNDAEDYRRRYLV